METKTEVVNVSRNFDMSQNSSCDYSMSQFKDDRSCEEVALNDPLAYDSDSAAGHGNGNGVKHEPDDDYDGAMNDEESEEDIPLSKRKKVESDSEDETPLSSRKKIKTEKKDKKKKKRAKDESDDFDEDDDDDESDYGQSKKKKIKKEAPTAVKVSSSDELNRFTIISNCVAFCLRRNPREPH